jgi:hypothetical protein
VLCVHPEPGEDDASWSDQAPALVMVTAGSLDPSDEVDDVLGSLDQPDGFTGSPDQAEGVTGSVDQPGAAGCSAGSAA